MMAWEKKTACYDKDDGRHHGLSECRINRGYFWPENLREFLPVLYECILLFGPYYHLRKVHGFELSDPPDGVDYTIKFQFYFQTTYRKSSAQKAP